MSTGQETAQCYHLSIKGQRCIREEGHQELHLSGTGIEWAIITKDTPELAAMSEEQPRPDGQGEATAMSGCICGSPVKMNFGMSICSGCGRRDVFCTCAGGPMYLKNETLVNQRQPQPHGTGLRVGDRLIELIQERTKLGVEKYGEPLTTHSGRDATLDGLQESVDLNQYMMQIIMEQEDEIKHLLEIIRKLLAVPKPHRIRFNEEAQDKAEQAIAAREEPSDGTPKDYGLPPDAGQRQM